ncbi:MAG: very short patch repair endonuclease [Chitinophagaceae bacterium]
MDTLNSDQRRKNMQAIKSKGTLAEDLLAKALWRKGYRYRRNVKLILGKPDIVFKKFKLVIFCDGEFWHGKNWEEKKKRLSVNKAYWVKKIEFNIQRDKYVNETLVGEGWTVMRFWDKEIHKNMARCLETIENVILQKS